MYKCGGVLYMNTQFQNVLLGLKTSYLKQGCKYTQVAQQIIKHNSAGVDKNCLQKGI